MTQTKWTSVPGPETILRRELSNGIVGLAYENPTSPSVVIEGRLYVNGLSVPREQAGLAALTRELLRAAPNSAALPRSTKPSRRSARRCNLTATGIPPVSAGAAWPRTCRCCSTFSPIACATPPFPPIRWKRRAASS